VGVRLRPLSESEQVTGERPCWEVQSDGKTLAFAAETADAAAPAAFASASPLPDGGEAGAQVAHRMPSPVAFDAAFPPSTGSDEVYGAAAAGLVAGACRGYNATIFAYGQTGSGKTHTMVPLVSAAVDDVFAYIDAAPDREFLLRVSAVEIYNEEVRDLLGPSWAKLGAPGAPSFGPPLKLLDDPVRGTVAEGLTEEGVLGVDHLHSLLATVHARRTVRDTRLNDSSSRSHLIVRLSMESRPSSAGPAPGAHRVARPADRAAVSVMSSTLTFVDLAGSERSRAVALDDGDRRRQVEGSHINKSLLTLGTVIRLLGNEKTKGKHIRFRDSKLTRMLQPALGGNTRTAIICTISPSLGQLDNTRSTISFAQHAKRVTNAPKLNQVVDAKAQIRQLQEEITSLQQRLHSGHAAPEAIPEESESAAMLAEQLSQKEERLRLTATQKDEAERKLRNLEKLILRAEPGGNPSMRASWAPQSMSKGGQAPRGSLLGGSLLGSFAGNARRHSDIHSPYQGSPSTGPDSKGSTDWQGMRSSWNPGSSVYVQTPRMGGPSRLNGQTGRRVGDASGLLLLNCFLSPAVVKHLKSAPTASTMEVAAGAKATAAAEISNLESPSDETAQAALEALQTEVRFMKQTQGGASNAIKILQSELRRIEEEKVIGEFLNSNKEETITAMRAEIERLKAEQKAAAAADSALANLKEKLNDIGSTEKSVSEASVVDLAAGPDEPTDIGATPPHMHKQASPHGVGEDHLVFKNTMRSPSASPQIDSPRASMLLANARMFGGPTPSPLGMSSRANKENDAGEAPQSGGQPPISPSGVSGAISPAGTGHGRSLSASVASGFRMRKPRELHLDEDSPAVSLYREELCKVKAFKAAAEKDVELLEDYLEEQREQAERLACQKKMLLNQVLKLEWKLEEAAEAAAEQADQLQSALAEAKRVKDLESALSEANVAAAKVEELEAELAEARSQLLELRRSQAIGTPVGSSGPPRVPPLVRIPNDVTMSMVDSARDGWAAPATVETLLPKIVALWQELSVPLLHRSRFYQAFRGRELFYYDAEHRRLEHIAARNRAAADATPRTAKAAAKQQQKAARKLEWERQWLAAQLKWEYEEADRMAILDAWGVPRDSKKRKVELMGKVWSSDTTQNGRSHEGMQRSADLVLELHGQDATEGMWEMVFGKEAAPARSSSAVGLPPGFERGIMRSFSTNAVTNTMKAVVKTPMRALTTTIKSPGGWLTPRSKSRISFSSAPGTPSSSSTATTPRRNLASMGGVI